MHWLVEKNALACREALSLAQDIGARRIEVSSDCSVVIEAIKQGTRSHFSSVVREIQAMIPLFEEVIFRHERRDWTCCLTCALYTYDY
jgi:ribonuclease HI